MSLPSLDKVNSNSPALRVRPVNFLVATICALVVNFVFVTVLSTPSLPTVTLNGVGSNS